MTSRLPFHWYTRESKKEQDAADSELSEQVNQMMGKYQMEGVEYLFKPGRKHAFLMSPYQCTTKITELWNGHKFSYHYPVHFV